jgi:hypothetical protein
VSKRVVAWMKIEVEKVNWFSTYRVHHRVADHFRKGRAFILGDAGHIHSPVGAQGMNTGIGDATPWRPPRGAPLQSRRISTRTRSLQRRKQQTVMSLRRKFDSDATLCR